MKRIHIRNAEILCVGTEILIGDIVNTNAAYLSSALAGLGIAQYYQAAVGDNAIRLSSSIRRALERCDLLLMSGGLGPTGDDLTKETAAAVMGRKLYLHEDSLARIQSYFASRGMTMTANNQKQAMMPEGAIIFPNDYGTAPGFAIEDEECGKIIICLPGPPRELIPMFDDRVLPYLRTFSENVFISRNINIAGMGESAVEAALAEQIHHAVNPTIAPYCKEGEVRLRVTACAPDEAEGVRMCDKVIHEIQESCVGPYIYGIDTDLPTAVLKALRSRSLTMGTAESCTGGLIAKTLTDVPGASDTFLGGIVSYTNAVKQALLSVPAETLVDYGAVSEETAAEMALGALNAIGCEISVAVTGIAGPGGALPDKPVGTVFISCAVRKGVPCACKDAALTRIAGDAGTAYVGRFAFRGDRAHVRQLTMVNALRMVLDAVRD